MGRRSYGGDVLATLEATRSTGPLSYEDWQEVYRRAWGVVRRIGNHITDPGFDLEDMVQVAVLGAWKALAEERPESPEHALNLLYRAMRVAVFTEFRRLYHQPKRTYAVVDPEAFIGTEEDPLLRLCARASVEEIRAFIETLSPIEQEAVRASVTARLYGGRAMRVITSKRVDNALQRVRRKVAGRFGQGSVRREGPLNQVLAAMRSRPETLPGGPGARREEISAWAHVEPKSASWILPRLIERGLLEVCGRRGKGRLYRLQANQEEATA